MDGSFARAGGRDRPLHEMSPGDASADVLCVEELGGIIREATLRTGAQTGLLAIWDAIGHEVTVLSSCGLASADRRAGERGGFVGRVLESGQFGIEPIDPERDGSLGIAASGIRVLHAAGVAVRPPGGPPGALCLGFSAPPADLDPALTLWSVEQYAAWAALCLFDAGVLGRLLATARPDDATGGWGLSTIRGDLDRAIASSARHARPLSCALIDLELVSGESHGDTLLDRAGLAGVSVALRDDRRVEDTLGRYGEHRLLAILPDTDEHAACLLAQGLQSTILTPARTHRGVRAHLHASISVARARPGRSAQEMLAAAGRAVDTAHAAGGGRVVGASGVAVEGGRGAAPGTTAALSAAARGAVRLASVSRPRGAPPGRA